MIPMDSKKFKSKLNKITTIFDSMQSDQSISTLEQELLKKYVIQLYETLIDKSKGSGKSQAEATKIQAAEPVVQNEPVKETPSIEPEPTVQASPVREASPQSNQPVATAPQSSQVVDNVSMVAAHEQTMPATAVASGASAVVANTLEMSDDLKPIFEKIEATDLSDRLSITKVKDIANSMGINEKIFTIKELFGGDQSLFNSVVSKLDACSSYDEAAQYLSSTVARDNKWADASKAKKAKTFVKLVQRKFV